MAYPDPVLMDFIRGERIDASSVTAAVVGSAIEHRVAPLLLDSMTAPETMDAVPAAQLNAFDLFVEAKRRELDTVMSLVHHRLNEVGIPHTFVKGATSAARWFDKPTHRPYVDVDILVAKKYLRKAVEALDETNAILTMPENDVERNLSSVVLVIEDVGVDLQTDALRSGLAPIDYTAWTVGSEIVAVKEDLSLPALDNEHDLVMFLLHQGRDRFRYLLGIAEGSRRLDAGIDWEAVESIARKEGIWEQVAVSLEVICEELGRPTPITTPRGWRTRLWRFLWRRKVRLLGDLGRVKHIRRARWLMPLTTKGRIADALKWLLRSAFPPNAILRLNHPRTRGPYLWRVVASRVHIVSSRRLRAWRNPTPKREPDPRAEK
jgi:hypothetical protein